MAQTLRVMTGLPKDPNSELVFMMGGSLWTIAPDLRDDVLSDFIGTGTRVAYTHK